MLKTNFPYWLAHRMSRSSHSSFSALVTRIAVWSIALGLAVMMLAFLIFKGFKEQVQEKIFSFSAHIQVLKYDSHNAFETQPLSYNRPLYQKPPAQVSHIQGFAQKPVLIKTDEEVMGAVFKGVGAEFDWQRFEKNMIEGRRIQIDTALGNDYAKELLISRTIADKLELKLHDTVTVFFMQEPPRVRKLLIVGIYQTSMEEFDKTLILGDLALIRRLNNWNDSIAGGYEIFIKDFEELDSGFESVYEAMDYDMHAIKVTDLYAMFFDWFVMINRNAVVFFCIILFVACFNTASILLILIMERTQLIGTLKALGARDSLIKQVFVYKGLNITAKGIFWGNSIGLGFAFLQDRFRFLPLKPEYYYLDAVPIGWDWQAILGVNMILLLLIGILLFVPVRIISHIQPIKAIRFD